MPETIRLDAGERRVLGVLIEKGLTTPQYYPMTVNAIVAAANQKNNRDPIVEMVEDDVRDILERLKARGLVTEVFPAGSRSEKWRQELSARLALDGEEMAVVGELLLRGAQTLGELRARASRMKPLETQEALQAVFDRLLARDPPLVLRLSEEGVRRGIRVTHGLSSEAEAARQESPGSSAAAAALVRSADARGARDSSAEIEALRRRVAAIELHLGIPPSD
ncbi:MAG: YceH family protein [Planctomycetes bacterium]|nr:YceH family protein [Planctomycetota bacterium]